MARKRSDEEEVSRTNRAMTPSEREEGAERRPEKAGADGLLMPRPATGRMMPDLAQPREKSETERAAERATRQRGAKE